MQSVPPDVLSNMQESAKFLKENGLDFLKHIQDMHKNNQQFAFLFPSSPYHQIFMNMINDNKQNQQQNQFQQQQNQSNSKFSSQPTQSQGQMFQYQQQQLPNYGQEQQQKQFNTQGMLPNYGTQQQQQFGGQNMQMPNYGNNMQQQQQQQGQGQLPNYSAVTINSNPIMNLQPNYGQMKYKNPEEVPVGVMADMLKVQQKLYKDRGIPFQSYQPLDPAFTPQEIKNAAKATDAIRGKIDLFYRYVEDEREIEKNQPKKKVKDPEIELEIMKSREKMKRDMEEPKKYGPKSDYRQNMINSEMGIRADGQSLSSGGGGGGQFGFGGPSQADIYANYRKQKSSAYHTVVEERNWGRGSVQLCYICQQPGHIARECKFGLT